MSTSLHTCPPEDASVRTTLIILDAIAEDLVAYDELTEGCLELVWFAELAGQ